MKREACRRLFSLGFGLLLFSCSLEPTPTRYSTFLSSLENRGGYYSGLATVQRGDEGRNYSIYDQKGKVYSLLKNIEPALIDKPMEIQSASDDCLYCPNTERYHQYFLELYPAYETFRIYYAVNEYGGASGSSYYAINKKEGELIAQAISEVIALRVTHF